jgi:hypothetical protein
MSADGTLIKHQIFEHSNSNWNDCRSWVFGSILLIIGHLLMVFVHSWGFLSWALIAKFSPGYQYPFI